MSSSIEETKSYFIDSHFHLDLFAHPFDLAEQIASLPIYCIAMTNAPSVYIKSSKLSSGKATIRTALGFHPQIVKDRFNEISLFKSFINETKYIGEIGLDFSNDFAGSKGIQIKVFREIIELCQMVGNKILSIHSRNSTEQVLEIIRNAKSCICILHWYSGSLHELAFAVEMGCYFSINSQMLNTDKGRKIVSRIPLSRILTESDGPFIKNNGKSSSPLSIPNLMDELAFLQNTHPNLMKETIWSNFNKILLITK